MSRRSTWGLRPVLSSSARRSQAISACGRVGKWQQASSFLHDMCASRVQRNTITYNATICAHDRTAIHKFLRRNCIHKGTVDPKDDHTSLSWDWSLPNILACLGTDSATDDNQPVSTASGLCRHSRPQTISILVVPKLVSFSSLQLTMTWPQLSAITSLRRVWSLLLSPIPEACDSGPAGPSHPQTQTHKHGSSEDWALESGGGTAPGAPGPGDGARGCRSAALELSGHSCIQVQPCVDHPISSQRESTCQCSASSCACYVRSPSTLP